MNLAAASRKTIANVFTSSRILWFYFPVVSLCLWALRWMLWSMSNDDLCSGWKLVFILVCQYLHHHHHHHHLSPWDQLRYNGSNLPKVNFVRYIWYVFSLQFPVLERTKKVLGKNWNRWESANYWNYWQNLQNTPLNW